MQPTGRTNSVACVSIAVLPAILLAESWVSCLAREREQLVATAEKSVSVSSFENSSLRFRRFRHRNAFDIWQVVSQKSKNGRLLHLAHNLNPVSGPLWRRPIASEPQLRPASRRRCSAAARITAQKTQEACAVHENDDVGIPCCGLYRRTPRAPA